MKKMAFVVPLLFLIISCDGQEKKIKTIKTDQTKGQNPKEEVHVNRTYDKKGNLVRFDSTYTYFYSSKGHDSSMVGLDTVIRHFNAFYNTDFSKKWNREFENMFLMDSLYQYDFPNKDFFSKRFELNMERMKKMMIQMDSLKTSYLKEPKLMNKKKEIQK